MTKGILLLAFGREGYGYMAFNLVLSIRAFSPTIPITLITDGQAIRYLNQDQKNLFTDIITVGQISDPGRFKSNIYNQLPYDYTLYLDVDAICLQDIEPLIDRLISDYEKDESKFFRVSIYDWYDERSPDDMPMMYWAKRSVIWDHFGLNGHKFPATQSSIQFVAKSERAEAFYSLVSKLMSESPIPLHNLKNLWGGGQPDELYFNVAIAMEGIDPTLENAIWFCDNRSKNPHEIKVDHFILSFFGVRGQCHKQFIEYHDREMFSLWKKMGFGNRIYKIHTLYNFKHAKQKGNPATLNHIRGGLPVSPRPTLPVEKPGAIHLFTSYFQTDNPKRNKEINDCLIKNLECASIAQIINLGTAFEHPKVINIPFKRPMFSDFVRAVNEHTGDYNIIANTDIYFTPEIEKIKDLGWHDLALALSRYDIKNTRAKLFNYNYSQDTWIFKGKLKDIQNVDFIMGRPGCDNRFAFEMQRAGYKVINPAIDIKTYHLHEINLRTYTEDDRIHGDYLSVDIESSHNYLSKRVLIHQPGKVGDLVCVLPICEHYAKEGYDVELLCPGEYHQMIGQADYVLPVVEKRGHYHKEVDLSFGLIQNTALHQLWIKRRSNLDSFVTLKYELSGVPIEKLRTLNYKRNEQKEKQLFDLVTGGSGISYQLVHGCSDYGSGIDVHCPNPVLFKPVSGYTIFDWRLVIEGASEIHCIDSSLANFVDCLTTEAKLFYYITDKVPEQADRTILTKNWETINILEYAGV